MNPFLKEFTTPPFELIKEEHYIPAITKSIEIAKEEINSIAKNKEQANFNNTIVALDNSGRLLDRITSILFNINSAETSSKIQEITKNISPILAEFRNDILLNQKLFQRVKSVYQQKETLNLTVEEYTLLEKHYKSFSRNGANLNDKDQTRLREIDIELSKLRLEFGENVLADTNDFELNIIEESKLEGLPEGAKEAARELARQKNKNGWSFTLNYPSYIPFITYVENRELRKKLCIAFGNKAYQNNSNNNEQVILKLVQLRKERANLLGYSTHANFVLEERMAKTPEKVNDFLTTLLNKAKPAAHREFEELEKFAKTLDNIDRLEKWDSAYYSNKLKKKLFDLDQELLKPYFKLENVIEGVFKISSRLYGINFKKVSTIQKYHPEVKTYEVFDNDNNFISHLYTDFHPRAGKRNGAWMTSFRSQEITNSQNIRPQISIVCNFTKSTATKPSLLTFNEVTTLFHEFGHALHGMLANTTYKSLSGTSVLWDFVELPSQLLENWCYEKEALELFAKHYKTKEVLPMDLIEKIKASANFQEGMQTLRQLSFGLLDMAWHTTDQNITNVKAFEKEIFKNTQLFPDIESNCMSTSFSHIFQGGYSSGYYSYKWAEVLDADAFEYFKEKGIFNKEVAQKFKENILSKGGTEPPMKLYSEFRGRQPKIDALLKRAGLN